MKPVGPSIEHPSSKTVDWQNEERTQQITEIASVGDFQQLQQLKWVAHVTRRENDIMKMLTFHTTSSIKQEKITTINTGKSDNSRLEKPISKQNWNWNEFSHGA